MAVNHQVVGSNPSWGGDIELWETRLLCRKKTLEVQQQHCKSVLLCCSFCAFKEKTSLFCTCISLRIFGFFSSSAAQHLGSLSRLLIKKKHMHIMYSFLFFVLFCYLLSPCVSFMDAPEPWQMTFQNPASPIAQGIQDLHHDIFFFMVFVVTFVLWMLGRTLWHFNVLSNPIPSKIVHGTVIEIAWTVTPSLILIIIALPSFALLYSMDEVQDPAITLKVIGHQWYWTYEYSDYTSADDQSIVFDSYMVPTDDLEPGQLRLLEVDNRIVLPINTHVRVIITGADVLHSWAIPSLGIKTDAVPGRLNQANLFLKREGVFYGQCSEICGVNHGFMPIVVEGVSLEDYVSWISSK